MFEKLSIAEQIFEEIKIIDKEIAASRDNMIKFFAEREADLSKLKEGTDNQAKFFAAIHALIQAQRNMIEEAKNKADTLMRDLDTFIKQLKEEPEKVRSLVFSNSLSSR